MHNVDWKKYKKLGKPKALKSPEHLWELATKYFEEVDANPILKEELLKGGERAGQAVNLRLKRPYTWSGFSAFLFMNSIVFKLDDYHRNTDGRYDHFSGTLANIDSVMRTQKFEGASVGIFSANLIARDLGLSEKTETTVTMEQPLFPDEDGEN